jgi:hypothetical protein
MNPANAWLLLTTRSRGVDTGRSGFGSLTRADVAHALQGLERANFLAGMAVLAGDREVYAELCRYLHQHIIGLAIEREWKSRRGFETYRRVAALAVFETLNGERCFVCRGKGVYDAPPERKAPAEDSQERQDLANAIRRLRRLEWRAVFLERNIQRRKIIKGATDPAEVRELKRVLRTINQFAQLTELLPEAAACITCGGTGRLRLNSVHRAWLTGFSTDHWRRVWVDRYDPLQHEVQFWVSRALTHLSDRLAVDAA